MINFSEMDIDGEIKAALADMGFESPTPIQQEVIPLIMDGKDVIAQAPTGTGKTCAFGIPVVDKIDLDIEGIQALILCPTRELVIQTENELRDVAKYNKDIKIVSIYGGQNFDRQLAGLRKRPQIIVGTTGRIMDHLRRRTLKLGDMKILVLDEVDEMLDMGFREDIDVILETVPAERQTVLFSATMPKEIVEISKRYQNAPVTIKTQHQKSDIPNINQYYVMVSESEKITALVSIMKQKNYGLALVFCNTKKRVDELNLHLNTLGINSDALHGDLRQHNRDKTMKKFRSGETQMLIATDVAARGLDVDNIEAVFNLDIPHDEEYYVHRIGRTARANEVGDAYTFVSSKQMYCIQNFERYTKNPILKAEFLGEVLEKNIDKKLFDKTLKLVKKADLTTYKEFLAAELEEFREKYDSTEMEDIAAALLLQLNEEHTAKNTVLSEPPKSMSKSSRKSNNQGGVRFFMNIGTRDKSDAESISRFIAAKAGIAATDILGVNCLENYSFANIKDGNNDLMESLNGLKLNKRIVAVEVAGGDKTKKPTKKESGESDRPYKSYKKESGESDRPYKSYKKESGESDRPYKSYKKESGESDRPYKSYKKESGESDTSYKPYKKDTSKKHTDSNKSGKFKSDFKPHKKRK